MGGMTVDAGTTKSVHFIVINHTTFHVYIMTEGLTLYGDDIFMSTIHVIESGIFPLSADGSGYGRALSIIQWGTMLHFIVTCMDFGATSPST